MSDVDMKRTTEILRALDLAVRAVCPIDGVSIRQPPEDRAQGAFIAAPEATAAQKQAAAAVLASWQPPPVA
jgi:hypothetical protein